MNKQLELQLNLAIAKFRGYTDLKTSSLVFGNKAIGIHPCFAGKGVVEIIPDFINDQSALSEVEQFAGLHDKNNHELRVRWINNLRMIVGEDMPKNKSGFAIVSDCDLLLAHTWQRAKALAASLKLTPVTIKTHETTISQT